MLNGCIGPLHGRGCYTHCLRACVCDLSVESSAALQDLVHRFDGRRSSPCRFGGRYSSCRQILGQTHFSVYFGGSRRVWTTSLRGAMYPAHPKWQKKTLARKFPILNLNIVWVGLSAGQKGTVELWKFSSYQDLHGSGILW